MSRPKHESSAPERHAARRSRRRPGGAAARHRPIPLTADGVPSATPDAPRSSPAVFVSDASRARFPWLPARVIAGSVWRGPEHVRVRVDENGDAAPWRCALVAAR